MSLFDRLLQSNLPQQLRGTEVKQAGTMERVGVQGRPDYPDVGLDSLKAAFTRSEVIYAALEAKADAAKQPRLRIQGRNSAKAEWENIDGHPLQRLLIRPNQGMDGAQLMRALVISWDVTRRVYIEKLYKNQDARTGALVGLNPLDPTKVTKQRDGRYKWHDGAQTVFFEPEQLLVREPGIFDPSPVAVCLGSVDADSGQTDYIRAFFNNGGVPAGVLTSDQELKQQQADEIRDRWRAMFGRLTGRQHDIAVLGKGTRYERMGANLGELQGDALREFVETRVFMTLKVPPLLVYAFAGLRRATYSNLRVAQSHWWDNQLGAQFQDWLSWLQWALLVEFEDEERIYSERVRLHWDMSTVPALQEDVDAKQTRAREAFKVGAMTLNELREILGEPPDTAGDYYLQPAAAVAVPAGQLPTAPAPVDDLPKALLTAMAYKATVDTIERRVARDVAGYLTDQYTTAANRVEE